MNEIYNKQISYISLDRLRLDYENTRIDYDNNLILELSNSIEEVGLINPLIIRPIYDNSHLSHYQVVSGNRRFKALEKITARNKVSKSLNKSIKFDVSKVKCIVVKTFNQSVLARIQLVENIQRVDLTDFELCQTIIGLWQTGKYESKQALAYSIGKSPVFISKCFTIAKKLNESIKQDLEQNNSNISVHILDEISRLSQGKQDKAIQGIKDGTFTRENVRALSRVDETEPALFDELSEIGLLLFDEISPAELSKHQHQHQDLKFVYLVNDGVSFNTHVLNFLNNPKFCTNEFACSVEFKFSSKYRVTIECLEG